MAAKAPPPLDEKKLRQSIERIERAWEGLRKHVLMGPVVTRAKLRVLEAPPQNPAMFCTVASTGEVFANPFNVPRTVEEWTYVQAHALLHLAFGHVTHARRGILWNLACDCVVNEFLARMRIGTAPEGLLRLPPGMPNDEDKLFAMWSRGVTPPVGQTTNGSAVDMTLTTPPKPHWPDTFARAVRRAARQSLSAAAGDPEELGPAPLARAWFVKNFPLLGAVLQQLKLVEDARLCERLGVRVAGFNAARREIVLNPGWAMAPEEYRFVLAHLALHAGFQHAQRRRGRDPFLWSAACDYCVNSWLARMPFLARACKAPSEGHLLAAEYQDLSPEEIYERLAKNPKAARRLVTFAGEGVPDLLGLDSLEKRHDRPLLDALLRGYQVHTESGKGALPHSLLDALRRLEAPPIPWDVRLGKWFDAHIPPVERVRTYARPSRRQSATPAIARPRYVWPDDENLQRSAFALVVDTSGGLAREQIARALGAIASYALARHIPLVRLVLSGSELQDRGLVGTDGLAQPLPISERSSAVLQPALDAIDATRDFPSDAPVLLLTGLPCDRVRTDRVHAFLVPEGGRLTFQSDADVIEMSDDED